MASYLKIHEHNEARRRPSPIIVRRRPGRPSEGLLRWGHLVFPCALGRGGIKAIKREGDGATPLARMRLLYGWQRGGWQGGRRSRLTLRRIGTDDGWCDAVDDRNYNRHVILPYPASCERMKRPDHLYDCCIVMDYNVSQRRRGMGSAVFFHLARPGFLPTEGCVAVEPRVMSRMLPYLSRKTVLVVTR
ncbi:L,D-transpeptidase family protein [Mesorhizobium sp. CAU 1741]|uniref:L,D-transpeptidase family protein n=1 Tax=Mesorhizobium sp. CAU 1741 TaxID=3140366 RepID=UPI00325BEEF1